jgi:type II secretory pathway component PulF
MKAFRYQAIELNGAPVKGEIQAADRKSALQLLGARGLFPSVLESCAQPAEAAARSTLTPPQHTGRLRAGGRVSGKDVTAFTREMGALLSAAIPIPQALDGLGEEEENPALRAIVLNIADSVRKGAALSAALEEHPKLFGKLYVSMVRVGEEAGVLPKVMADLAELLEHEDELRGEVLAAVAYPVFVLCFGFVTVAVLLTVVMPKLFSMLTEMATTLPLPTVILLRVSGFIQHFWIPLVVGAAAAIAGLRWFLRSPKGAEKWDGVKLGLPVLGGVYRAAALSRFARTLGTLAKSGVSLLPALKIVENTIGNLVLGKLVAQVAEETRGGDSLAAPLRKLEIFPKTVVQMISVGEESGMLPEMLLKVADIEERHMRARAKTLISLLAPALILVVGALVGFMVIALLLPIFNMSQALER